MAAFNSPGSAGVYAPWRFGNLNDGANCGLPCANGNNSPANANWNGVPRHADEIKPEKGRKRRTALAAMLLKSCNTDTAQLAPCERYAGAGERAAVGHGPAWRQVVENRLPCDKGWGGNRKPLNISKKEGGRNAQQTIQEADAWAGRACGSGCL